LLNALTSAYTISTDRTGKNYCGLTLDWDYTGRTVDISIPNYIHKVLLKYQHPPPNRPTYAPHTYNEPVYGQRHQMAPDPDDSSYLSPKGIKEIQGIIGSLLYYARAVDPTMLTTLNELSSEQAKPTANTRKKVNMLLDYAHTYPNSALRYRASDMILIVESDAAYLVLPNAKSRIAGYFYLSEDTRSNDTITQPKRNGPLHIVCKTLKHVVASAAEAETGGLFINAQETIPLRYVLQQLGHEQPPTPIKTDNTTALSFVNANIRQKRSKSWDMRYYWLRDRLIQNSMYFYWEKGSNNDADYFTKHHAPNHHLTNRQKFIFTKQICDHLYKHSGNVIACLRGCVDTLRTPIFTAHTSAQQFTANAA
jgi:hypothetical protein